ncbi:hypothetical protein FGB62_163g071 [Gracilaria domingensis]|nr:hypothetical protein FGB62_163g071 [Gracilaria domingensis]
MHGDGAAASGFTPAHASRLTAAPAAFVAYRSYPYPCAHASSQVGPLQRSRDETRRLPTRDHGRSPSRVDHPHGSTTFTVDDRHDSNLSTFSSLGRSFKRQHRAQVHFDAHHTLTVAPPRLCSSAPEAPKIRPRLPPNSAHIHAPAVRTSIHQSPSRVCSSSNAALQAKESCAHVNKLQQPVHDVRLIADMSGWGMFSRQLPDAIRAMLNGRDMLAQVRAACPEPGSHPKRTTHAPTTNNLYAAALSRRCRHHVASDCLGPHCAPQSYH